MYSAYKLNKQGDNIQPWRTPFLIWNQSVVTCPFSLLANAFKRNLSFVLQSSKAFTGDSVEFYLSPVLLKNSDFKGIPPQPFAFWKQTKNPKISHCKEPSFPHDLGMTHGCPPLFVKDKARHRPSKFSSLPPKPQLKCWSLLGHQSKMLVCPALVVSLLPPDPELWPTLSPSQHAAPWRIHWTLGKASSSRKNKGGEVEWEEACLLPS